MRSQSFPLSLLPFISVTLCYLLHCLHRIDCLDFSTLVIETSTYWDPKDFNIVENSDKSIRELRASDI